MSQPDHKKKRDMLKTPESVSMINQSFRDLAKEALTVTNAEAEFWSDTTDVAIVGYGAAGACAALEAADNNAQVTVLDRLGGGGASALSGGVIYAGGGTQVQREAGEGDSVDNMTNYLCQESGGVVSEGAVREFADQSARNIEWLTGHGVQFDSTAYEPKTSYPPNGYFLYYSGNEKSYPFNKVAKPVRRGHRVAGKGFTGHRLFSSLDRSARDRAEITIKLHCEVQRLIVNEDERVIGVEYLEAPKSAAVRCIISSLNRFANKFSVLEPAIGSGIRSLVHLLRKTGETRRLRASKGVVLCAGGFIFNRSLVREIAPAYHPARPLGEDCVGIGIGLGVSVGGDLGCIDHVSAWRFYAPPNSMLSGIIVDSRGDRICNEDMYGATVADHVLATADKKAFLILDREMHARASAETNFSTMPWFQWISARLFLTLVSVRAASIEKLAVKCSICPSGLVRTIEDYNLGARTGKDVLGKSLDYLKPFEDGPYYALEISLTNRRVPCFAITLGGLKVDEKRGAVVTKQNLAIPGLYAAGRNAVGICSNNYLSGLSLADCVFSGRRAGRSAALDANDQP